MSDSSSKKLGSSLSNLRTRLGNKKTVLSKQIKGSILKQKFLLEYSMASVHGNTKAMAVAGYNYRFTSFSIDPSENNRDSLKVAISNVVDSGNEVALESGIDALMKLTLEDPKLVEATAEIIRGALHLQPKAKDKLNALVAMGKAKTTKKVDESILGVMESAHGLDKLNIQKARTVLSKLGLSSKEESQAYVDLSEGISRRLGKPTAFSVLCGIDGLLSQYESANVAERRGLERKLAAVVAEGLMPRRGKTGPWISAAYKEKIAAGLEKVDPAGRSIVFAEAGALIFDKGSKRLGYLVSIENVLRDYRKDPVGMAADLAHYIVGMRNNANGLTKEVKELIMRNFLAVEPKKHEAAMKQMKAYLRKNSLKDITKTYGWDKLHAGALKPEEPKPEAKTPEPKPEPKPEVKSDPETISVEIPSLIKSLKKITEQNGAKKEPVEKEMEITQRSSFIAMEMLNARGKEALSRYKWEEESFDLNKGGKISEFAEAIMVADNSLHGGVKHNPPLRSALEKMAKKDSEVVEVAFNLASRKARLAGDIKRAARYNLAKTQLLAQHDQYDPQRWMKVGNALAIATEVEEIKPNEFTIALEDRKLSAEEARHVALGAFNAFEALQNSEMAKEMSASYIQKSDNGTIRSDAKIADDSVRAVLLSAQNMQQQPKNTSSLKQAYALRNTNILGRALGRSRMAVGRMGEVLANWGRKGSVDQQLDLS